MSELDWSPVVIVAIICAIAGVLLLVLDAVWSYFQDKQDLKRWAGRKDED